jgi:N-acetylglucosaminyl-diphospho-decaprenol L-rhamnosyltransferase
MIDLTLSIVSHGHIKLLDRLMQQLAKQKNLAGIHIIITLNLNDENLEVSNYKPLNVQLIRNIKALGFGANHNKAFMHCQTRWFGILNPDLSICELEPFTGIIAFAERSASTGVVAPLVINEDHVPEDSVRTNLTPWSLLGRYFHCMRHSVEFDGPSRLGSDFYWLAGMCLVVSSQAFRHVGGFDERFFLYCEDYDLCARFYNAGYSIEQDRSVRIIHTGHRDSHRKVRYLFWHISSLIKVWVSEAFWQVLKNGFSRY